MACAVIATSVNNAVDNNSFLIFADSVFSGCKDNTLFPISILQSTKQGKTPQKLSKGEKNFFIGNFADCVKMLIFVT
jgi:hypothetical protein